MTSSLERLSALPAVFVGRDLSLGMGMTSAAVSQSLWRWRRAGYIASVRGADVHVNLTKGPPDWEAALARALPTAVLVGAEALRQAGWSTQVPDRPAVAVPPHGARLVVPGYRLVVRPPQWRLAVTPGIIAAQSDDNPGPLPRLGPAWALADMLAGNPVDFQETDLGGDGWAAMGLHPDDIDPVSPSGRMTRAILRSWEHACAALEVDHCLGLDVGIVAGDRSDSPSMKRRSAQEWSAFSTGADLGP